MKKLYNSPVCESTLLLSEAVILLESTFDMPIGNDDYDFKTPDKIA